MRRLVASKLTHFSWRWFNFAFWTGRTRLLQKLKKINTFPLLIDIMGLIYQSNVETSADPCAQINLRQSSRVIYETFVCRQLGLGDILHAICMRISSVKPVPWLAVNLITCFQMERHLIHRAVVHRQATHISTDISPSIWTRYCVACQWFTALCIKCRSIWKQVMEINR